MWGEEDGHDYSWDSTRQAPQGNAAVALASLRRLTTPLGCVNCVGVRDEKSPRLKELRVQHSALNGRQGAAPAAGTRH